MNKIKANAKPVTDAELDQIEERNLATRIRRIFLPESTGENKNIKAASKFKGNQFPGGRSDLNRYAEAPPIVEASNSTDPKDPCASQGGDSWATVLLQG